MTILEQYNEIKSKHKDSIILLRCGDFYETYSEDAKTVAFATGITLSKRKDGTLFAGFPAYCLDEYYPMIVRKGHKIVFSDD